MDQEDSYHKLSPNEALWRRRLYWLLFITERAYAVQTHKHTRLTVSIQLPEIFPNEDAMLVSGFQSLATLFSAVNDDFVKAWRGSRKSSLCNEAWLVQTQERFEKATMGVQNLSETQHLDISVTREWLHMLAWQVGLRNGLIWGKGPSEGGMRLSYPIELAKKVVDIISMASPQALDSHGIGMEQKLSDIAHCVADVLRITVGDPSEMWANGTKYLGILVQRLSSIRGKESRYLKPLMDKASPLLEGWKLNNTQTLPLPVEPTMSYHLPYMNPTSNPFLNSGPRRSVQESLEILRSLSMNGDLGMPSVGLAIEDWPPMRRESGRVLDEAEAEDVESWFMSTGVEQAV